MSMFVEKGYHVSENAPVYMTQDMDATAKWFEEVLGWYSNIVNRDETGKGCYGVVFEILPEVELAHLAHFTGIHLFAGKPRGGSVSFMQVRGIDKMHDYIVSKGWNKITDVQLQPWGSKTCTLTTVDGYTIDIFE